MIVPSISWWCKNGASHRKNFETSPLNGVLRGNFRLTYANLLRRKQLRGKIAPARAGASESARVSAGELAENKASLVEAVVSHASHGEYLLTLHP